VWQAKEVAAEFAYCDYAVAFFRFILEQFAVLPDSVLDGKTDRALGKRPEMRYNALR
jgi:hypothetical protein